MLQFLKYVFATIVGIFLFTVLSFFLLLGIGSLMSSSDTKTEVAANSVLKLDLNQVIRENAPEEDPLNDILSGGNSPGQVSLPQIKEALANAKIDPNIKGIYLKAENPMAGFATLKEVREYLLDFKKSNKFIYSYAETMTEGGIYLASVADKSYITPAGGVDFNGLSANYTFMKGLFEKIGIKPEIFRVGEYKSAVEPFFLTKMSDANREQTQSFISDIANNFYGDIASARKLSLEEVNTILNKALIQEPSDAVKYKILTNTGYWDEFETALRHELGSEKDKKIEYITLNKYLKADKLVKEGSNSNRIAVIVGEGDILSGESQDGTIGSETIVKELQKARKDSKIKAIVLRINSGGGSALASDVMWREVELTKKVKPVIASMGDYAASGGYYMAMGCDTIVAQPTTLTGSIGIFGVMFNVEKLMNEKLGVTFDGVKSHEYANFPSATRTMTDAEKNMIQNGVNKGYESFTSKAAKGRHMSVEKLKSLASGRVWTGSQGQANGLVDILGGIDVAIKVAAQKAKLKEGDYRVKYLPIQKSSIETLIEKFGNDQEDAKLKAYLGDFAPYAKQLKNLQSMDKIQARMPFELEIK
ncbi:signal peptide peptidase SppA, 67K type [Emticicia oligotrophica DSM 17448]|uniref:Signal peptide peptidase SppA, 67K type n=1 Tax=Emticicia oligotrophica (strain DSM 17448 / CIP 109782 / MTCC 6937 / GPTSA100-15) TaxID=929562 RepID=A0ABN4AKK6_EMTOG|nr:signal peptide peptidase SppA [Emticicia oligotrophica]AFK02832.1 signal peptide peptidase SppA, 67K type [Emticicia oligotrophica DSM 17448]